MKRRSVLFSLFCLSLFVVGCWEQFTPPEVDDDDTTVDDDDDTTVPDDDDTTPPPDDDDTAPPVDDDDAAPPECSAAGVIACGEDYPANNNAPGSTNVVDGYSCNTLPYVGPEYAVQWDADITGPATVRISGLSPGEDLDLFVLGDPAGTHCDPAECVGASAGSGTEEEVTFDAVAGQTYYFVADGYSGGVSNFVMNLDCTGGGDDDDDTTVPDDDDTTVPDDDDTTDPCLGPPNITPTITLTDAAGNPTTSLAAGSPLTVNVQVQNQGGDSGTTSFTYGSSCIFNWSLWYQNGNPVTGGPVCLSVVTNQNYGCGDPAVSGSDSVEPIEGVSNNPVPPGTYDLLVDTIYFGLFSYQVTVP
ncbi:MAG: PPC domain-containing protein [Myxococcota bacterium]|nr:PPC domain-containing protein [Myxococcota bacterium]